MLVPIDGVSPFKGYFLKITNECKTCTWDSSTAYVFGEYSEMAASFFGRFERSAMAHHDRTGHTVKVTLSLGGYIGGYG